MWIFTFLIEPASCVSLFLRLIVSEICPYDTILPFIGFAASSAADAGTPLPCIIVCVTAVCACLSA